MAQQTINYGTAPDGAGGDNRRAALEKLEANDTELYGLASTNATSAAGAQASANAAQAAAVAAQTASFKNKLINGNFSWWQRGTSLAASSVGRYLADRWKSSGLGATTLAPSQQAFGLGQSTVPNNPSFFHRCVVAASSGASDGALMWQGVEGVAALSGKTVTLSFWAKADANKNIAIEFQQVFGSSGSPSASVTGIGAQLIAITTAWAKYSVTVSIPSIAGKTLGTDSTDCTNFSIWLDAGSSWATRAANLGHQSGTFDIAQVQIEEGVSATAFEVRPPAIELAMCLRYCFAVSLPVGGAFATGVQYATTGALCGFNTPVLMRSTPTMTISGQGIGWVGDGTVNSANPTLAAGWNSQFVFVFTISGATQGKSGYAAAKAGGATFLLLESEL